MSISEQVKELRDKADIFEKSGCAVDGIVRAFRQAADTIESLSAKLQAVNMERPAEDCDGWIYCGDGRNLPKEEGFYLVTLDNEDVMDDMRVVKAFFYKKYKNFIGYGNIIAWKPLPEPCHEP